MLHRPAQQSAPAAPEIEHPVAGFQQQLTANMIQLVRLRGVDVFGACAEVRSRINHLSVEPETIEII
jgi:hypothetical protein